MIIRLLIDFFYKIKSLIFSINSTTAPLYRVGRLKHERVVVDRQGDLLKCAMRVFHCHADRKAVLEVGGI